MADKVRMLTDEELEKLMVAGGWRYSDLAPADKAEYDRLYNAAVYADDDAAMVAFNNFVLRMNGKYGE